MRKGIWLAAASVALVAAAPVLFIGPTVQAADNVTMGSSSEQYALKFFPAEITVQVGSTVVWQNLSDLQHDAKADNGAFASKLLNKGEKFEFTFSSPGDFTYFCTPHKDSGMKGTIHVAAGAGGATTTTAAATSTTTPAGAATTTTAAGATTTTTAKAAAGASSTTTTTAAAGGATTTTLAPAATPTSAPESANGATATTAQAGEEAAADHSTEGGEHKKKKEEKNSPIGIAFASVSTLLLAAIAGKLLASKP